MGNFKKDKSVVSRDFVGWDVTPTITNFPGERGLA